MFNAYVETLFDKDICECRCLGLSLETLTFGHLFFMELVGSKYSFCGKTKCNELDLISAVYICHHTPDELLAKKDNSENIPFELEKWANELVKQILPTLTARELQEITNSDGDYAKLISKVVTPKDHKDFQDYLAWSNKTPAFRITQTETNGPRSFVGDLDNLFDFVQCQHPDWTDEQLFNYSIKRARLARLHYMSKEGIGVFVHPAVAEQPAMQIVSINPNYKKERYGKRA